MGVRSTLHSCSSLNSFKCATWGYAYLKHIHYQLGAFLASAPDVNGRYVETITLGALLISPPDLISCGHRTITVSRRKTIAEAILFTIADCSILVRPLSLQFARFPCWRLFSISLRVLNAAREQRRMSIQKQPQGVAIGD